eukprot:TCONS_00051374-protein
MVYRLSLHAFKTLCWPQLRSTLSCFGKPSARFYQYRSCDAMKVLIDCDPGIDDAIALGIALSKKDLQIVGITTVQGNVDVHQCAVNALKILEAYDRLDIPVFKGSSTAIIKHDKDAGHFHGKDGLGDVLKHGPDENVIQKEHGVSAINRLAQEHQGELTLIAIGPLTNLALALRLNPSLPSQLKELIIMGGNYKGVGNVTMAAEFNFWADPHAAQIVLEEFKCPKYLITWELSRKCFLTSNDVIQYCNTGTKQSEFKKMILAAKGKVENHTSGFCDAVAVGVALYRDMITKTHEVYATVELEGTHTKGMVICDWCPEFRTEGGVKKPNMIIVDQIDEELYRKVFLNSTK